MKRSLGCLPALGPVLCAVIPSSLSQVPRRPYRVFHNTDRIALDMGASSSFKQAAFVDRQGKGNDLMRRDLRCFESAPI